MVSEGHVGTLIGQLVQALEHDAAGIEGHGFGLERRQPFGDDVGVDELVDGQGADQDVGGRRGLTGAVGTGDDDDVGA